MEVACVDGTRILIAFSYIFANFQIQEIPNDSPSSKTIPTFLALYSFGFLYELVLVYDALRMKNTIQVIGLCICNIGLLIYGAVQVNQIRTAVSVLADMDTISPVVWAQSEPFLIIIPCIVALGTFLMTFVAWKLYDEFAWTIYKHISADLQMKRRYLTYQVRLSPTPPTNTTNWLDLHRAVEIRFLLLPRLHSPVPGSGLLSQDGRRVRAHGSRHPSDHYHSSLRRMVRATRNHRGHGLHHRKTTTFTFLSNY
jgi:hypothetical protein